ncbi:hypothetical protein T12_5045 [Trichinella patagoniensis]|uniref:Uncharacterized protein n=1 Tax=Trichinella patagoniensis TaxID=990121 RepID=A0A0V1A686_9BILA|nr:hypothetical protein T12_5045 [Trichinella patagoniensis]
MLPTKRELGKRGGRAGTTLLRRQMIPLGRAARYTAVVTTPREETAAASPSPVSESVGQQRSCTRKRRPPQWLRDYEC